MIECVCKDGAMLEVSQKALHYHKNKKNKKKKPINQIKCYIKTDPPFSDKDLINLPDSRQHVC